MASRLIYALLSAVMAALMAIFGKLGLAGVGCQYGNGHAFGDHGFFGVGILVYEGKLGYFWSPSNSILIFAQSLNGTQRPLQWQNRQCGGLAELSDSCGGKNDENGAM